MSEHMAGASTNFLATLDSTTLARFAMLFFENSYDSVVITTGDPSNHKILYVNQAFTRMTGYEASEVVGKKPSFLGGEKTNLETIAYLKSCLERMKPFEGATTNYRKDGTPYYVKWNIQVVRDNEGKVEYFIAIQQDLSKLKNSLNRLKSTSAHFKAFLGDISRQSDLLTKENDAIVDSAKRELTAELNANQTHLEEVEQEVELDLADDDLFDDDLFGDDDDDLFDIDEPEQTKEVAQHAKQSATEFLDKNELGLTDLSGLLSVINDLETNADALMISGDKAHEFSAITHDFQEMANAIFYLEEFIELSLSLSELAVVMTEISVDEVDDLVLDVVRAVIADIKTWLTAVFVEKTAEDIHFLDSSIISSAQQIMSFIRMAH